MISLGIESTAHTFGVGIIDDKGKIYANERILFTTEEGEGGMIPAEVATHHVDNFQNVLNKALFKADLTVDNIDLITYSQGPGMGHSLRIGAMVARTLASTYNKPIIGVNHCIAHLEIGKQMTKASDPVFLYASGANTQIIAFDGGKYRVFGETLDCGIGNFLDSFARHIGLGFPGGPKLYELSLKAKNFIKLPYTVKGMDLSFGGLLTNLKQKYDSKKYSKEDLAFSLQETAFTMLVEVSERAMAHTGKKEILLGGGVACSKRLQEMCKVMCEERGAKMFTVPNDINVDNGLMIAWLGLIEHNAGKKQTIKESTIHPYQRTDDIEVFW